MDSFDVCVIGAGIVGLASARELLRRYRTLRVTVVDKEESPGQHQTSHNSGVIHSGIYYRPGSNRARLCVDGAIELYSYCESRGIPYERRGKLIVAVHESELGRLHDLLAQGIANGVGGISLLDRDQLHRMEPNCGGIAAIWSRNTGITDFRKVALAYVEDIRASGGTVMTGREVVRITRSSVAVVVHTKLGEIKARLVISCAGLHADRVARLSHGAPEPAIVPFRGDYWILRPRSGVRLTRLIYPVPNPAFPFLGVHLTPRIDGEVWAGPNAVLALAREGYKRTSFRLGDFVETLSHPGFRKLVARHWRTGLTEWGTDLSKQIFIRAIRPYVPEIRNEDLIPGPTGVRAQAIGLDGSLLDDFIVDQQDRQILHVRNAPSPAATASLGIGRLVADRAAEFLE